MLINNVGLQKFIFPYYNMIINKKFVMCVSHNMFIPMEKSICMLYNNEYMVI